MMPFRSILAAFCAFAVWLTLAMLGRFDSAIVALLVILLIVGCAPRER